MPRVCGRERALMIRAAVVGVGHFGREHARIYSASEHATLVAVCDLDEARGRSVAQANGADFVVDFRELSGRVDAVSVAAPTVAHHAVASELLEAGIAVLVEKPI